MFTIFVKKNAFWGNLGKTETITGIILFEGEVSARSVLSAFL